MKQYEVFNEIYHQERTGKERSCGVGLTSEFRYFFIKNSRQYRLWEKKGAGYSDLRIHFKIFQNSISG